MSRKVRPSAMVSSLDHIQIAPRTPKIPRTSHTANGMGDGSHEIELSLLGDAERREAVRGLEEHEVETARVPSWPDSKRPFSSKDKKAMALLIVLCL